MAKAKTDPSTNGLIKAVVNDFGAAEEARRATDLKTASSKQARRDQGSLHRYIATGSSDR
jgi:hypothetical protein